MSKTILSARPDKAAKKQRILERLDELSAQTGTPVNRMVFEALRRYLVEEERANLDLPQLVIDLGNRVTALEKGSI